MSTRQPDRGKKRALLGALGVLVLLVLVALASSSEIYGWYRLVREFERLEVNPQGYREYRHRGTGIVFVHVPGGRFIMGSVEIQGSYRDERPQHDVKLSGFLIAKYELRKSEWQGPAPARSDGLVRLASWDESKAFCTLSGLKLPTEAQWEYACRAGTQGPYGGTGSLDGMGWHLGTGGRRAYTPGQMKPNAFGIYDMHGGVWEWCEDVYDANFYSSFKATGWNPVCDSGSPNRVRRGGGWRSSPAGCRSAFRGNADPLSRSGTQGLRPVWTFP